MQIEDLSKTTCKLTWEVPEFDGGSPITGYIVERLSGKSSKWLKVKKDLVSELELDITDMVEGEQYELRVLAVNAAGTSKPSETTGKFVAKDPYTVPDKPGTPEVTAIAPNSAALKWAPPQNDGGSPVTGYVVEMKPVGDTKWKPVNKENPTTETELTVPELTEGKEYEFRVAAMNKAGTGQPSSPCKAVKYGTLK